MDGEGFGEWVLAAVGEKVAQRGAEFVVEAVVEPAEGGENDFWISLELGGAGDKLALNARVKITAGALVQTDEVRSSGSYLSQSDLRLHFGLAAHRRADKLEIFWPSGARETLTGLDADHAYCIGEGAGVLPCGAIRPTRILVR